MKEFQIPRVGFVRLSRWDFLYLVLGFGLAGNAVWTVATGPANAVSIGLNAVVILTSALIWATTLFHGRRRIQWDEWVNPISQQEVILNHARFEGF